jgi:hypothetical protein
VKLKKKNTVPNNNHKKKSRKLLGELEDMNQNIIKITIFSLFMNTQLR